MAEKAGFFPPSREPNTLWVGQSLDGRDVVVNHPNIQPDADGAGYIVFSPRQARALAELLLKHAEQIEARKEPSCDEVVGGVPLS